MADRAGGRRVPDRPERHGPERGAARRLRAGGLPDRAAAVAVHLLPLCVIAFVRDEVGGLSGHDAPPEQVLEQIGAYFAGLPAERFPNYTELGPLIVGIRWDERFELMLAVLIAGLSALARS